MTPGEPHGDHHSIHFHSVSEAAFYNNMEQLNGIECESLADDKDNLLRKIEG